MRVQDIERPAPYGLEYQPLKGSQKIKGERLLTRDGVDRPDIETRLKEAEVRIVVLEELTLALSHALMEANQGSDRDLGRALALAAQRAAESGNSEVERMLRSRAARFDR